jgi:hypothetical protein
LFAHQLVKDECDSTRKSFHIEEPVDMRSVHPDPDDSLFFDKGVGDRQDRVIAQACLPHKLQKCDPGCAAASHACEDLLAGRGAAHLLEPTTCTCFVQTRDWGSIDNTSTSKNLHRRTKYEVVARNEQHGLTETQPRETNGYFWLMIYFVQEHGRHGIGCECVHLHARAMLESCGAREHTQLDIHGCYGRESAERHDDITSVYLGDFDAGKVEGGTRGGVRLFLRTLMDLHTTHAYGALFGLKLYILPRTHAAVEQCSGSDCAETSDRKCAIERQAHHDLVIVLWHTKRNV